ncbi:MAG TPA: hypothetical protein VN380_18330 [Thermoanaerobaculia bacterium]|nr:hypothetical protein [Thermoanaerobaculia bacterium]
MFQAADISSVIWIDDKFDSTPPQLSVVSIRAVAATAIASNILPSHPALSHLTLEMTAEQWASAIQELAVTDDENARAAFLALERQVEPESSQEADYNEDEIAAILKSFDDVAVTQVGREKWIAEKEELKRAVSAETVVIVDREFYIDGAVSNLGDDILREFATPAAGNVAGNLVMLTHSFTREQADDATEKLAQDLQIDRTKFAVMSKHRTTVGSPDTEEQLRRSFRVVFTQRACIELAGALVTEMESEMRTTLQQLSAESVFELDRAVFQNSLNEGASELDVIARIFMLRQRVRAQTVFSTNANCKREVGRIRKLRQLEELPPMAERQPSTRLLEWRRDEVFDPPDRVNATRSPLVNGDIFKTGNSLYVLLAQDCDLVVRSNGSRAATEGFFIRAKHLDAGGEAARVRAGDAANQCFYKLPAFVDQSTWRLDFRVWAAVNLCCLDLAVFNDDGSLSASSAMTPSELLLPGWHVKAEKVRKRLEQAKDIPSEYRALSVGRLSKREPAFANGNLSFDYKRVGRLRPPWAVAAYAAFTAYHTRAAFDHDFAEGLSSRQVRADEEQ